MSGTLLVRCAAMLVAVFAFAATCVADDADPPAAPDKYILDYPAATQFCPPVESYFEDAESTIQKIGGRTIRHQLNGGYGLPVVDQVGDQNLLHLGADVSWHRPVPVYAIGDGVVRISSGGPSTADLAKLMAAARPAKSGDNADDKKGKPAVKPATAKKPQLLGWGNLIVIEHRLPNGNYYTSIYGHLASRRLVAVGDVVTAGQVIGTVAKSKLENGGYDPHLHFAVRDGRMAEPGRHLVGRKADGKFLPMKILDVNEREVQFDLDEGTAAEMQITLPGDPMQVTTRDGKHFLPARLLNYIPAADFPIVGYGLSTEGFHDPTAFLREVRADSFPAEFQAFPRQAAVAKAK